MTVVLTGTEIVLYSSVTWYRTVTVLKYTWFYEAIEVIRGAVRVMILNQYLVL